MIGVRLNHAQLCNGYAGYQSVVLFKRCTHVVMTVCVVNQQLHPGVVLVLGILSVFPLMVENNFCFACQQHVWIKRYLFWVLK